MRKYFFISRKSRVVRDFKRFLRRKHISINTLSVINAVQLCGALSRSFFHLCAWTGSLSTRLLFTILEAVGRSVGFCAHVLHTKTTCALRFFANRISNTKTKEKQIFTLQLGFRPQYSHKRSSYETRDLRHPPFLLPFRWQRHILFFVVLSAVLVLPFKAITLFGKMQEVAEGFMTSAKGGLQELEEAKSALSSFRLREAENHFASALHNFDNAQHQTQKINAGFFEILKSIPGKGRTLNDAELLISAGKKISKAGEVMASAFGPLTEKNITPQTAYSALTTSRDVLIQALSLSQSAVDDLQHVNLQSLPSKYRAQFLAGRDDIEHFTRTLSETESLARTVLNILGAQAKKRYLMVFQNDSEIRPTGGFIGTFSLVDVDNGVIKKIETPGGGSYDLQGSLRPRVISPYPLHMVNPAWQFQDANWFPDFPTSAKKLMWFYEKSGGPTVDGVIAVNASLAARLVGLVGPIDMPEYGVAVTEKNFYEEIQKQVELEYDRAKNRPKQFLSDLFPRLLEKLSGMVTTDGSELSKLFIQAALSRDIQVYLSDKTDQRVIASYGLSGELTTTQSDFLMVVRANVSGGKSDAVIDEFIDHSVALQDDGTLSAKVRIIRTHHGDPTHPFYGTKNTQYVRLYVPKGSTLISAKGFHPIKPTDLKPPLPFYSEDADLKTVQGAIQFDPVTAMYYNNEFGRTVFANWIQVSPSQTVISEITYRLPFTVVSLRKNDKGESLYSLVFQRQPGSRTQEYDFRLSVPANRAIIWASDGSNVHDITAQWISQRPSTDIRHSVIIK
ncbi:DUF4012 domain-containing protein [Candidatus Uhrbacteria bacterium]|nr:DUF4012 domain-containing protein [Candidatus Uhrbacteria bacterium]